MAFIKAQKVVRNESGMITSGSASIVDTVYVSTGEKSHSKQVVREKLGRVLYLSEDRKCGVFMSPTRGLIEYDALSDSFGIVEQNDPRISGHELFPEAEIHTVFGDAYLFFSFLEKCGMLAVLRKAFPEDGVYERALCHILHDSLRDGSRISCDRFLSKSFASYILKDVSLESLRCDADYYTTLGAKDVKGAYFQAFVAAMREKEPSFGSKCCIGSMPLPGGLDSSPFKALRSGDAVSRDGVPQLILVFDEASGLPVWYDLLPGGCPDMGVITALLKEVEAGLNITIDSLILDGDYVSRDFISAFHSGAPTRFIGKMPAKKGYPFRALYLEMKDLIGSGDYTFTYKEHPFFGIRKKVILFNQPLYAYVFIDQTKARRGLDAFLADHENNFAGLKDEDKDWYRVRYGYFVLISNISADPRQLLADYFEKTGKEIVFKTARDYLAIMPLSKWTDASVRGKLLHDLMDTTVMNLLMKQLLPSGLSTSDLFGSCQSLMCCRKKDGTITIETPNKDVQACYKTLTASVPSHLKEDAFRKTLGLGM